MVFERLQAAFQRAASSVPAYRRLLQEHDVDASAIVDCETFAARCPILSKANTFDRFSIDQLCAEGAMADLADVFTSSGHGGRFSFGLSTRRQKADGPAMIDYALDEAFSISQRRTLVINCLPMGVRFFSQCRPLRRPVFARTWRWRWSARSAKATIRSSSFATLVHQAADRPRARAGCRLAAISGRHRDRRGDLRRAFPPLRRL